MAANLIMQPAQPQQLQSKMYIDNVTQNQNAGPGKYPLDPSQIFCPALLLPGPQPPQGQPGAGGPPTVTTCNLVKMDVKIECNIATAIVTIEGNWVQDVSPNVIN